MADRGIDMGESGYDSSKAGAQEVQVVLSPSQAAKLESDGIDVSAAPDRRPDAQVEEGAGRQPAYRSSTSR